MIGHMVTRFINKVLEPCAVYYLIKYYLELWPSYLLGTVKRLFWGVFFSFIRLEMNSDCEGGDQYNIFILQFSRTNEKHDSFRISFSKVTKGRGRWIWGSSWSLLSFLRISDTEFLSSLASFIQQLLTQNFITVKLLYLVLGKNKNKQKTPRGDQEVSEMQEMQESWALWKF